MFPPNNNMYFIAMLLFCLCVEEQDGHIHQTESDVK